MLNLSIFNTLEKAIHIPMQGKFQELNNNPLIVNADQLNTLLSRGDCFTSRRHKVVRFLLRLNEELVFAAEGIPGGHIPAHFQMASISPFNALCLSAGNAFFDENNKLCAIDHKSGDFRPSFDSLQFALRAFLIAHVPMKHEIKVKKLNSVGGYEKDYLIKVEDIGKDIVELQKIKFANLLAKLQIKTNELIAKGTCQDATFDFQYIKVMEVAKTLNLALENAGNDFFASPSLTTLRSFQQTCNTAIQNAVTEFKNNRSSWSIKTWNNIHPILKGILGLAALITFIPALIVTMKSKHGYVNTFFAKRQTQSFEALQAFERGEVEIVKTIGSVYTTNSL